MVTNKYRCDDVGGQVIWIKSSARESARVVCKYTSTGGLNVGSRHPQSTIIVALNISTQLRRLPESSQLRAFSFGNKFPHSVMRVCLGFVFFEQ